ncbi:hypothetical protein E4665_08925 [Sporolactobacillus shoreae]|uniref:Uncharacterized protein n=1 Tax=Sporolactobacillus shoreae TaxID=1465501 RepID=A0A4Z0GNA2_9BACL|nr:hypothetical protein E4665_08925 [Sporolactobacillus shoreae]
MKCGNVRSAALSLKRRNRITSAQRPALSTITSPHSTRAAKVDFDHKMLWFESKNRAKIEAKKCKFQLGFLAVFMDDIKSNRNVAVK